MHQRKSGFSIRVLLVGEIYKVNIFAAKQWWGEWGGQASFSGSAGNAPVFPARENPAKLHQNFRMHSGVTKNIPKGTRRAWILHASQRVNINCT